jgi:hypothetical protein
MEQHPWRRLFHLRLRSRAGEIWGLKCYDVHEIVRQGCADNEISVTSPEIPALQLIRAHPICYLALSRIRIFKMRIQLS